MNGFPTNRRLPDPLPVSGPPQPLPPGVVGNTGVIYGTQQRPVWQPGETDARQVCDALKSGALWRFSAFGRVIITIDYGTQGTRKIFSLRAPVVLTIPGQFTATATPIDNAGTTCTVALTQATAGARSIARQFVDAGAGPPVALDDGAVDFWALTASTLTISGAAVVAPALTIVPLVSGAVLNTGSGFQEFEA
jgi:hypothetical protein